jgi:hypothetical protein
MYVCVDFDGTMVAHEYPKIGRDIGAFAWLQSAQKKGARIILFTMRSGKELDEAVALCKERGIDLYGINHNPDQDAWTTSPKAYGNIYIDDAAFGCPLAVSSKIVRPYVDWSIVGPGLLEMLSDNPNPKE